MKVKIRHIEDANAVDFTECKFNELPNVVDLVIQLGGFCIEGDMHPFNSYQLVYNENAEAFAEIIIGSDD